MNNRFERLNQFIERIKTITLFQRIFSWKIIRALSYDAYEEYKSLVDLANNLSQSLEQTNNSISLLKKDHEHFNSNYTSLENDHKNLKTENEKNEREIKSMTAAIASKDENIKQDEKKIIELEKDLSQMKQRTDQLERDKIELTKENHTFKQNENNNRDEFDKKLLVLTNEIERIRNERTKEQDEYNKAEIAKYESKKETWAKHQDLVKETIKIICQKHTIDYLDKVPFKGTPDNTILIADEYVIFDAKSPASDDLNNFPVYIKSQTESVKKYVKEENVKKEIYLVIPSNTVETIKQYSFNMADYSVFVVTLDALEPIILSLKKLEEYEFIEQLSPEERESICRVIGKFAHMTKRRIQIDQFFERQFLEVLNKCESDLPREILEKVIDYEKSEKLNPPQEKRAKLISSKELEVDSHKIRKEIEAKEINSIQIQEISTNRDTKRIE